MGDGGVQASVVRINTGLQQVNHWCPEPHTRLFSGRGPWLGVNDRVTTSVHVSWPQEASLP